MLRETYVVAAGPRGLVLIDPVAAQQRVLFEYLLRNAAAAEVLRQQLLIPVTLEVGLDDARRLRQCLGDLGKLGFSIEPFGGNTFLVTAVPARFPPDDLSGLLRDILDEVSEHGRLAPDSADVRLARAAVRHAALSRRPMNERELAQLLQELSRTEMPYTDPSGAPVMVHLPHAEIERRFGRRGGV
ncbi:MAG: hypothetical protein GX595_20515 [Lentisphaerae bacterium]|nr:hypothetical protein [Lentisphaerota bacterium]